MNNEKTMRFETMKEAFDYANSLDIKSKVFDSRYGLAYEVSGTN